MMIWILKKERLRLEKKVGSGSHNGMKSVQKELGTDIFPIFRIGIGTPNYKNDMVNYVLAKIPEEEYNILEQGIKKASIAVVDIIKNGIDHAMNQYN